MLGDHDDIIFHRSPLPCSSLGQYHWPDSPLQSVILTGPCSPDHLPHRAVRFTAAIAGETLPRPPVSGERRCPGVHPVPHHLKIERIFRHCRQNSHTTRGENRLRAAPKSKHNSVKTWRKNFAFSSGRTLPYIAAPARREMEGSGGRRQVCEGVAWELPAVGNNVPEDINPACGEESHRFLNSHIAVSTCKPNGKA